MKTMFRRRALIALLMGGGVAAALGTYVAFPFSSRERLAHLIKTRLDYLTIPDDVLNQFVGDFLAYSDRHERLSTMVLSAAHRALSAPHFLRKRLPIPRYERWVIAQFLLSTDFFREGGNVNRPVRYVAYSDPYKLGCANPLAKIGLT